MLSSQVAADVSIQIRAHSLVFGTITEPSARHIHATKIDLAITWACLLDRLTFQCTHGASGLVQGSFRI
mgnify:CR=1 FL=1